MQTTHRITAVAAAAMLGLGAGCGAGGESPALHDAAAQRASHPAFLHGRVTLVDGEEYRGRLRFGGTEEAFWSDYFYGRKDENPWVTHMPPDERPRQGIRLVGIRLGAEAAAIRRPFMARMGDIARIEARGRDLAVTMKNGTVHHLNRYAADDFADGVRVWDAERGVVDLNERRVRTIEFEPPAHAGTAAPYRLLGTVYTPAGAFTGLIQWDRTGSVAMDDLRGENAAGESVALPFATVRSIARISDQSARVTLLDGSERVLSNSRHIGTGNRGIYVDDARYGRVLVPWPVLDRAEFTPVGAGSAESGPAYDDFSPGRPLAGTVTTLSGQRLSGRLVFDLDESESTATLDAPLRGVHYTLPFERVSAIVLPGGGEGGSGTVAVLLRSGEALQLERAGDLGRENGGLLIFTAARERAEYVPWRDVARIDFVAGGEPLSACLAKCRPGGPANPLTVPQAATAPAAACHPMPAPPSASAPPSGPCRAAAADHAASTR